MQPYAYQQECLNALSTAHQNLRRKVLVVMATGLGKTFVSALALRRLLEQSPGRVLYLCHQNDILHQAHLTFEQVFGRSYTYGYFHGSEKYCHGVDILFASFQTMVNHRDLFARDEFKYVVVDEVHHVHAETFRPTVEYFQPNLMIGLTATPERGDGLDIQSIFGPPVYSLDIFEALARRYLCRVDYRLMTDDIQDLKVLDTSLGKLSVKKLNRSLFIPKRDQEIARLIEEKAARVKNPRVMIFCPTILHAETLAGYMPHAGVIHSALGIRHEDRRRLDMFRRGAIDTVLTVDKLNEGIDIPQANVIVFLRSTSSKTVFLQQLGRGLRRAEGKESVLVLDFVANCERIEMVDELKRSIVAALPVREGAHSGNEEPISHHDGPIVVNRDNIEFDEVAKKVLDVVRRLRGGYTAEEIIRQLQALATELGRTPTANDVQKACAEGRSVDPSTIKEYFGAFNKALEAAALTPNQIRGRSDESLLDDLRAVAARQDASRLTKRDVDTAARRGECANASTYINRFGSISAAFTAAGLGVGRSNTSQPEAIRQLQQLYTRKGQSLNTKLVAEAAKEGFLSPPVYRRLFGSLEAACRAANVPYKALPKGPAH